MKDISGSSTFNADGFAGIINTPVTLSGYPISMFHNYGTKLDSLLPKVAGAAVSHWRFANSVLWESGVDGFQLTWTTF